jgi:hypothetical protein
VAIGKFDQPQHWGLQADAEGDKKAKLLWFKLNRELLKVEADVRSLIGEMLDLVKVAGAENADATATIQYVVRNGLSNLGEDGAQVFERTLSY